MSGIANAVENISMKQLNSLLDFYDRYRKPTQCKRVPMNVDAEHLAALPGMIPTGKYREFAYRGRTIVSVAPCPCGCDDRDALPSEHRVEVIT